MIYSKDNTNDEKPVEQPKPKQGTGTVGGTTGKPKK
jgi:hypothetical protein